MAWIELHDSARHHPKVLGLSRDTGETWPTAFGFVCALWSWTVQTSPDGDLSNYAPEDIEFQCGWTGEPGALFEAMVKRGLIDRTECGVFVHDWDEFAGSYKAAEKKRKQRKKKTVQGLSRDKAGTVPATDRPTDPTTERGDQFTTRPPPPLPPVFHPTSEHEAAIHKLRDHHAKLHGIQPRGFLTNREDLERIAKVLDEYGEPACLRIIEGHKRLCDQGKESKKGFVFAFPWTKDQRAEPNWDWIAEHAAAKKKTKHHTQSEVDETPEQRYRRQQAEEAALTPEQRAERERAAEEAKRKLAEMKREIGNGQ